MLPIVKSHNDPIDLLAREPKCIRLFALPQHIRIGGPLGQDLRNSSGSLAIFTAIRRASRR
jgi:hypothetical protein